VRQFKPVDTMNYRIVYPYITIKYIIFKYYKILLTSTLYYSVAMSQQIIIIIIKYTIAFIVSVGSV